MTHLESIVLITYFSDFFGPLPASRKSGAKYILSVRDAFSKWTEAIPMKRITAEETVRALEKEIFSRYGYPEAIHSDCGAQFTSRLFEEMGDLLGIQVTTTTAYNPKSNAQVSCNLHALLQSK